MVWLAGSLAISQSGSQLIWRSENLVFWWSSNFGSLVVWLSAELGGKENIAIWQYFGLAVLRCCGLAVWHSGNLALCQFRYSGSLVFWHSGSLVVCQSGSLALW